MRPGDPNAWELTAPEEERARPSGFVPGMRYGTGGNDLSPAPELPAETYQRGWNDGYHLHALMHSPTRSGAVLVYALVTFAVVLGFVAGALAGGWRP